MIQKLIISINQLKSYSKDIYKLAYFIPLNLKQVKVA